MSDEWLDVSDITPRIAYTATASQTLFAVPFVFFENGNLLVYQNAVLLTLDTDYTVTGAEDESGGAVTLLTGATVGDSIVIVRDVPVEQTTHIPPSGPLDIPAINIQFSKLIAILQQFVNGVARSLRLADADPDVSLTLPLAADRALQMLGFDASGAPTPMQPSNSPVSVAMQPVVAAATLSAARTLLGLSQSSGGIYGMALSNNASDLTNDIDIAAGEATDSTNAITIIMASGFTKRTDVNWVSGTGNGGLDTGAVGNGTYHVFVIQRPDSGAVDVLFSLSPSAPTMPSADWVYFRRIGSIIRAGGTILAFRQFGDTFKLSTPVVDRSNTAVVTDILITLTVPSGIKVMPILTVDQQQNAAGSGIQLFDDGDLLIANVPVTRTAVASEYSVGQAINFVTNTASQLRYTLVNSVSMTSARIFTIGWIDGRGR